MGVVYRAHDSLLEREVALKIIGASIEGHPDLRERFFREARAAGQLSHRNIITIHDLGEHEGQPYLAMEFLSGEDLQHRLTRPEPLTLTRKLEIAAEICEGLSYAHRRGLIHRDIKPANIFITNEGVVKLLDFGLARMVTSELTKSNVMLGTLNYMAPEQVRGERIDHRADIFSFGVVLYEILSGKKAFQGDSFATTLYKILQDVPEPLQNIDATLPHEVVMLVERAIAKGREDRYQDLSELCRDLALQRQHLALADAPTSMRPASGPHRVPSDPPRLAARRPDSGPPRSAPPVDAISPTILSDAPTGGTPLPMPRPERSKVGIVAAVAVVAAVFAGIGWLARRDRTPAQQASVDSPSPAPAPAATPPAASTAPAPAPAGTPPGSLTAPADVDTQAVEDARGRMARAKAAARQAGSRAVRSPSFAAALSAERDGLRSYQSKRLVEAVAKFYEATNLFRNAELAAVTPEAAPPPPAQATPTARNQPAQAAPPVAAPAPPVQSPAPTTSTPPTTTSTAPPPETPVQLPPAAVPGPPVPPPARTTTAPAAPPESPKALEESVRDLVRRYEQALEARSVDALKRLWPALQGAQEDAIRQEFSHARRIDVEITSLSIDLNGATAVVTFVRRYELLTVDGQRLLRNSRTTLNARRSGDDWVIERVRFEALK